jgi:hypothetical protein
MGQVGYLGENNGSGWVFGVCFWVGLGFGFFVFWFFVLWLGCFVLLFLVCKSGFLEIA